MSFGITQEMGKPIRILDEGITLVNSVGSIDFVGAGVTGTNLGAAVTETIPGDGSGTVTSVALSVPTGLSISGSPITTTGTLALTLTAGYVIPTSTSLAGYVTTDQTVGQTIGVTGTRLTKLWAVDLTVSNAIGGSVTGNAGTVSGATFTTALTVNTGTLTLTAAAANTSILTIGAGPVSI